MLHTEPMYRRKLLRALLLVTAVSGVLFAWLNLSRGVYLLAALELLAAIYSLFLYPVVGRTRRLGVWTLAYLLPFLSVMMVALAQPKATPTVFVWTFLIPQIAYLLTGKIRGFIITLAFLILATAIFLNRFGEADAQHPVGVFNILVCMLVIWGFAHYYEAGREKFSSLLINLAERDSLTGLLNRMRFTEVVEAELFNAAVRGHPMGLILIDIDHFKQINDRYGHPVGDRVLVQVAQLMSSLVRKSDYVFRIGGEEFCIVLPGAGRKESLRVAEQLTTKLTARSDWSSPLDEALTVSIGIAVSGLDGSSAEALYAVADQYLYAAKASGRNRVISSDSNAPDDAGTAE